jgi:hypothetical protein
MPQTELSPIRIAFPWCSERAVKTAITKSEKPRIGAFEKEAIWIIAIPARKELVDPRAGIKGLRNV